MSFLKDKPQFPRGVADVPVEAVAPEPEFDIVIGGTNGYLTRHDIGDAEIRPTQIRIKGPGKNYTVYPMTGVAFYAVEQRTGIQSSNGKDAA